MSIRRIGVCNRAITDMELCRDLGLSRVRAREEQEVCVSRVPVPSLAPRSRAFSCDKVRYTHTPLATEAWAYPCLQPSCSHCDLQPLSHRSLRGSIDSAHHLRPKVTNVGNAAQMGCVPLEGAPRRVPVPDALALSLRNTRAPARSSSKRSMAVFPKAKNMLPQSVSARASHT